MDGQSFDKFIQFVVQYSCPLPNVIGIFLEYHISRNRVMEVSKYKNIFCLKKFLQRDSIYIIKSCYRRPTVTENIFTL